MIRVKSTIKINRHKIKQLTAAASTALEMTAEAVHTDVVNSKVMPRDTGTLQGQNSSTLKAGERIEGEYGTEKKNDVVINEITKCESGKVSIITVGPQARRLYFHPEYNFRKTNNPNAGGQWFEEYMNGSKKDFAFETFKEFYRQELKRRL